MTTLSKVDVTSQWTLVYDASVSGQFRGSVCAISRDEVAFRVATSAPEASDPGMTTSDWMIVALSQDAGDKLYAKSSGGGSMVIMDRSMGLGALPPWLLSSDKENIGRVQVDVGNTGFFDNREFRYFREFDIPTGVKWWIKVVVPANGILIQNQVLTLGSGQVRFRAWRDLDIDATFVSPGTPADVHTNDSALCSGLFGQNGLPSAPDFTGQTLITQSGAETSVTGGTCSEVKRVRTSGATAQQISVGFTTSDERGIAPATYHLELQSLGTGNAVGVYDLKFEERLGQG